MRPRRPGGTTHSPGRSFRRTEATPSEVSARPTQRMEPPPAPNPGRLLDRRSGAVPTRPRRRNRAATLAHRARWTAPETRGHTTPTDPSGGTPTTPDPLACAKPTDLLSTWTDHTNVRPTMLSLLGLHDDYVDDGRVLVEGLDPKATPHGLVAHRETVRRLGDVAGRIRDELNAGAFDGRSLDEQLAKEEI